MRGAGLTSFVVSGFAALAFPAQLTAEQSSEQAGATYSAKAAVPSYCGIEALYAALSSLNIHCRFETLVSPEFVGSVDGSSLAELNKASESCGAYSLAIERLSIEDLRASPHPVILHFSPEGRYGAFTHWVCYLGLADGCLRILDPGYPVQLMSAAEVLSRWDGTGLLVASHPVAWLSVTRGSHFSLLGYLLPIAAIGTQRLLWRQRAARCRIFDDSLQKVHCQALLIFSSASIVAVSMQIVAPYSFWTNSEIANAIACAHCPTYLRHISREELDALNCAGQVVVVDSRASDDYLAGHIDCAISLPVNSDRTARLAALKEVPKSGPIVVYCQSQHCPFAHVLSTLLISDGYTNISVLDGGWAEWRAWKSRQVLQLPIANVESLPLITL